MELNLENQQILKRITNLKSETGQLLIKKFSIEYLISYLDRAKIQSIDKIYQSKEGGFNILQFIRFFLNVIQHKDVQTLYLTIALIDLFRQISQSNGFCQRIKFTYITNFICSKILEKRNSQNQIETKFIPQQKNIQPNYQLKDYLLNPPTVYGSTQQSVLKLSANKIIIDKNKHQSVVTNCFFSSSLNKIFALDALSDFISIYDTQCNLIKKIKPSSSHLKKNTIILSFAYSEKQQRIGAVLKDFSLIFWDNIDNWTYQKVILTASHCHQNQSTISYLKHFNKWITTDKLGNIYVWDIQSQQPQREITCKFKTKINDLCEIPCLNLLAIVQQNRNHKFDLCQKKDSISSSSPHGSFTMENKTNALNLKDFLQKKKKKMFNDQQEIQQIALSVQVREQTKQKKDKQQQMLKNYIYLYNFFKGEAVAKIDLGVQGRIPHTIQYSESYQTIITASYQKKINIYQIHPKYLDTNIKGSLLGHQTLVTCFTTVPNTPMIVSCDDKGKIKIWDIRNYKCIQTLDFKDKTVVSKLLSLVQVGKIGMLGSRINLVQFDDKNQLVKKNLKKQKLYPIAINCDYQNMELIVLTKNDMRIIDIRKGLVKHIFCQFFSNQEEVTCFKYLELLKKFVIGNQKGQLKIFCIKTGNLQRKLISHTASVMFIQYDQNNKLFISGSADSSIFVQKENSQWGLLKQIKNNFYQKDIMCMSVSVYHGFIAIGSTQNLVYIWDYQFVKLLAEIKLSQNIQPTVLQFINHYSCLMVGCSNGQSYLIKLTRKDDQLITQCIWYHCFEDQPNHFLSDILVRGSHKKIKLQSSKFYAGTASGKLYAFDFSKLLESLKKQPNISSKQSFNPERQLKQNFITQIDKKKYSTIDLSNINLKEQNAKINSKERPKVKIEQFSGHYNYITAMDIIQMKNRYLFTGSADQRIKIWKDNVQICDLNINHPLPYQWDLIAIQETKMNQKIMIGLKVIQSIFKKYGSDISIGQSKTLKIQKLFQQISVDQESYAHLTEPKPRNNCNQSQEKIRLFQQQFTLQDLNYNLVKKYNFKQIAGPSLRQIQMKKKIDILHKQWHQNKKTQQMEKSKLLYNIQHRAQKIQQKQQILNFLKQKNRNSNQFTKKEKQHGTILHLSQKLKLIYDKDKNQTLSKITNRKQNKAQLLVSNFFQSKILKQTEKKRKKLKSFQNYYQQRDLCSLQKQNILNSQNLSISNSFKNNKTSISYKKISNQSAFRNILNDMDNRIKMSRKNKFRTHQNSLISSPISTPDPYSTSYSNFPTKYNFFMRTSHDFVKKRKQFIR